MGDVLFYFAPMEGVTTAALRCVHHRMFPGIDRYFTPFLTATQTRSFRTRELRDIDPTQNDGMPLAVQVQASDPELFVWTALRMESLGYTQVNLNLGCPASTAVSRGRGAGMLADPQRLDRFFDEAFGQLEKAAARVQITVKTRVGLDDIQTAPALLQVFNRYPICELIVHPRLRTDYYGGEPRLDVFEDWLRGSIHPVCYNGDITTSSVFEKIRSRFPQLERFMIGRGLLRNPALARELAGGASLTGRELADYMQEVLAAHVRSGIGVHNTVWRMKELWSYIRPAFPESGRGFKMLRKARDLPAYEAAIQEIFTGEMVKPEGIGAAPVRL